MTKGRSDYTGAGFGTAVATYRQLSDVSLPDDVRSAPFLRDLCSAEAKGYLSSLPTSMLRPADEFAALEAEVFVEPYMDPVLKNSRRKYKELVANLDHRGLIYWSTTRRERCAVFFVKNKSGNLRFIIDAHRCNLRFRDPPGVDLCSAECFGRMEVEVEAPPDDGYERMPGGAGAGPAALRPALGMVDVRDGFLRMVIGGELAEYF